MIPGTRTGIEYVYILVLQYCCTSVYLVLQHRMYLSCWNVSGSRWLRTAVILSGFYTIIFEFGVPWPW